MALWSTTKAKSYYGVSPEEAALRETREKTGYSAEIICQLPGSFGGEVTSTIMFLMRPRGEPVPFCWETSEIRWVNPAEAPVLIALTTHKTGRDRDLAATLMSAGLAGT